MTETTAVWFDVDGTLVEFDGDYRAAFERALADHGVDPRPEHHETYLDSFFEYLDAAHPEPYAAAVADLSATFDLSVESDAVAAAYVDRELAGTVPVDGAREALAGLSEYRLGALTNGAGPLQRRKLAEHDLDEFFDAVVVSGDTGACKPDREIFDAARDALDADDHVFVSDDLERDVRPAQAAGFTGVWLAGDGDSDESVSAGDTDRDPDARVVDLADLTEFEVP